MPIHNETNETAPVSKERFFDSKEYMNKGFIGSFALFGAGYMLDSGTLATVGVTGFFVFGLLASTNKEPSSVDQESGSQAQHDSIQGE